MIWYAEFDTPDQNEVLLVGSNNHLDANIILAWKAEGVKVESCNLKEKTEHVKLNVES